MADSTAEKRFSLVAASASDVPALVKAHLSGFEKDEFSNLMLLGRDTNAFEALMTSSVESWAADPNAELAKCVDETGQVLGWSCCILKDEEDVKPAEPNVPDAEASREQEVADANPRSLGRFKGKNSTKEEQKHLAGKKHLVLQALVTDPRFQGRGVGLELSKWFADRADAFGVIGWTEASPASYRLYGKVGFEEVGSATYDLSKWAPVNDRHRREWGVYKFRYMLRPTRIEN